MVGKGHLVQKAELKTDFLEQYTQLQNPKIYVTYDDVVDLLILRFELSDRETVVHYLNEYVGLIYDAETLQVIGIQAENYELGLKKSRANISQSENVAPPQLVDGFKALNLEDMPSSIYDLIRNIIKSIKTDPYEPIVEELASLPF